jgi:hypothetical protein
MAYPHARSLWRNSPVPRDSQPFGNLTLLGHYTARVVSAKAHQARKRARKSLRSIRRNILRPLLVLPARRILMRRVPTALITGTKVKTATTRMLDPYSHRGRPQSRIHVDRRYRHQRRAIERSRFVRLCGCRAYTELFLDHGGGIGDGTWRSPAQRTLCRSL